MWPSAMPKETGLSNAPRRRHRHPSSASWVLGGGRDMTERDKKLCEAFDTTPEEVEADVEKY